MWATTITVSMLIEDRVASKVLDKFAESGSKGAAFVEIDAAVTTSLKLNCPRLWPSPTLLNSSSSFLPSYLEIY